MANSLVLKSVVYDTLIRRLGRETLIVVFTAAFQRRFVAKLNAINYVLIRQCSHVF